MATKTSVHRRSSLADNIHCRKYFVSGSETSSRMCGFGLGEIWSDSVSKNESNGTSLQHVDIEQTDDPYWPTDYEMEMYARDLEADISGFSFSFSSQHDVECHYQSEGSNNAEPSSETIENCSGIGGAGARVNVTRTECLMYSPRERTRIRKDGLFVNSNSGDCDVSRARTEETGENINKISEIVKAQMG